MNCPNCGIKVLYSEVTCGTCGASIVETSTSTRKHSIDGKAANTFFHLISTNKMRIQIGLFVALLAISVVVTLTFVFKKPTAAVIRNCPTCTQNQSDLSNILTSAKAVYTTTDSYGGGVTAVFVKAIKSQTPSVTFVNSKSLTFKDAGKPVVGVQVFSPTIVFLYGRDATGGCWGISSDTSTSSLDIFPTGIAYWWSTAKGADKECDVLTLTKAPFDRTDSMHGPILRSKN